MALDDFYEALNQFKSGLHELQMQRTISQANDAVQQIRSSELKDEEKTNQLRGVAEKLTYHLAAGGTPATTIQALTQYVPAQKTPATAEQAALFGTPDQQAKANTYLNDSEHRKLELQNAKMEGMMSIAQLKGAQAQAKGSDLSANQLANLNDKFSKFVQPDDKSKSAIAQATLNGQRADNLRTLVGGDLSDDKLNHIPKQQIAELAIGMATLVKNGVASDNEVKLIFPETANMDKAQVSTYLESNPQPANQAEFVKLYLKTVQREQAQAQSQVEDSIIKRANGHAYIKADPEGAKVKLAGVLGVKPEDVIIGNNGAVTTTQKQFQDQKMDKYSDVLTNMYKQAKGGDANSKALLLKRGIDPDSMTLPQLKNEIKFQIRQGNW